MVNENANPKSEILNNNANYKKMKSHDDISILNGHGIKDNNIETSTSKELLAIRRSIREQIEEALANPLAGQ